MEGVTRDVRVGQRGEMGRVSHSISKDIYLFLAFIASSVLMSLLPVGLHVSSIAATRDASQCCVWMCFDGIESIAKEVPREWLLA